MDGLEAAGHVLQAQMQKTVGVKGTPVVRSRPGEPPRRQRGTLLRSITMRSYRAAGYVLVGSANIIAWWLDRGTTQMAARPWVWPSYYAARQRMNEAFRTRTKESVRRRLGVK